MENEISKGSIANFFENYVEQNSILILLYVIISGTFYVIYWLYKTNLELSLVDEDAPNPDRAISVLLLLPSLFFLISYIFKKFIFNFSNSSLLGISWNFNINLISNNFEYLYGIFEFSIWILIIFLILKYFYDFSVSYSKITKTNFFVWYLFLSSEAFGFIFLLFSNYLFTTISFFTIISVPAMQEKLNILANKYQIKKEREIDLKYGSHS